MLELTLDTILFVTCDKIGYIECRIANWIWKFVPVILIVFGLVGNILNIMVLLRKQLRKKSTCVFLLFLAFSDSTLLVSGALVQTLRASYGCNIYDGYPYLCNIPRWLSHSSGYTSCWLIVFVTIERSMMTLFPVQAKPKLTPRNALIASLGLVIFSTTYSSHLAYGYIVADRNTTIQNTTDIVCSLSCNVRPGIYAKFLNNTWSLMVNVTGIYLPICLIIAGNAIVGISLVKHKRNMRRVRHQDENNRMHNISNTSTSAMKSFSTRIFFILSIVYIVTTVPYGALIMNLKQNKLVDEHTFSQYQLVNVIVRCIMWCNFSFNFLLYFMTGSLFKKEFKEMITSTMQFFRSLTRTPADVTNG